MAATAAKDNITRAGAPKTRVGLRYRIYTIAFSFLLTRYLESGHQSDARPPKIQTGVRYLQKLLMEIESTNNTTSKAERLEWVKSMRNKFSPSAMLSADGEINQEFFKPTQVAKEQQLFLKLSQTM